jgi:hypothetical protein
LVTVGALLTGAGVGWPVKIAYKKIGRSLNTTGHHSFSPKNWGFRFGPSRVTRKG